MKTIDVQWTEADVASIAAETVGIVLTKKEAEDFIKRNGERIRERIMEIGFSRIEQAIRLDKPWVKR